MSIRNGGVSYKYQVNFVKTFLSGYLQGVRISDTVRFASRKSAEDWITAVSKRKDLIFSDFAVFQIKTAQ